MIIHMTTVHPRDDSRIRYKEISALITGLDTEVRLYVQDGLGDENDPTHGYKIVDTGPRMRRLKRATQGAYRMIKQVLNAKPEIVFFHDPELQIWAYWLELRGIRVVYDVHEDYPQAIKINVRISKYLRFVLPPIITIVEWLSGLMLSWFIGATEEITKRFPTKKTILLRNFPIQEELHVPSAVKMEDRPEQFTYIGTISENRNVFGMIEAISKVQSPGARFRLAGTFDTAELTSDAENMAGWDRVIFDGWVSREDVASLLSDSRAGLLLIKPIPHEMVSLPIKLFEYMAAGLPIISSDFPVWRGIIDQAGCGLLVDPEDTTAIAEAMQWILDHPKEAAEMGRNGRKAIEKQYNWEREKHKLLDLVKSI